MTKDVAILLPAGRELDALVAEKVMGLKVLGVTTCVHVEGGWSIHPDTEPESWSCFSERAPVYSEQCFCDGKRPEDDWDKRHHVFGHDTSCLEVVPPYSTSIADAWTLMEKLRSEDWLVVVKHMPPGKPYIIEGARSEYDAPCDDKKVWHGKAFVDLQFMGEPWRLGEHRAADTVPLAICRCALAAMWVNNGR